MPNHSQSHPATPPRGPIFDSPPPARLDHHESSLSESVKTTCQGSGSSRPHARLDFTRNPDDQPDQVPPCTVNSPKTVLSTVPCTSAGSAFSPPCGSLAEGPTLHMSSRAFPAASRQPYIIRSQIGLRVRPLQEPSPCLALPPSL